MSLAKVCERYSRISEQTNTQTNKQSVKCPHGVAKICTVSKDGPNKGRQFYTCKTSMYNFFVCLRDIIGIEPITIYGIMLVSIKHVIALILSYNFKVQVQVVGPR